MVKTLIGTAKIQSLCFFYNPIVSNVFKQVCCIVGNEQCKKFVVWNGMGNGKDIETWEILMEQLEVFLIYLQVVRHQCQDISTSTRIEFINCITLS